MVDSRWNRPETVAGFTRTPPNADLLRFAESELRRVGSGRVLDLGCGAGRNALPLARQGWEVLGIDRSKPMLLVSASDPWPGYNSASLADDAAQPGRTIGAYEAVSSLDGGGMHEVDERPWA